MGGACMGVCACTCVWMHVYVWAGVAADVALPAVSSTCTILTVSLSMQPWLASLRFSHYLIAEVSNGNFDVHEVEICDGRFS
eukprot:jgi/Botrbrau1/8686/Bobra.0311s0001.1